MPKARQINKKGDSQEIYKYLSLSTNARASSSSSQKLPSKSNTRSRRLTSTSMGDCNDNEMPSTPKRARTRMQNDAFKGFEQNCKSLEEISKIKTQTSTGYALPVSLEDLSDDEDSYLAETAREMDTLINSQQIQKLQADNELKIQFDCALYEFVGKRPSVFNICDLADLRKIKSGTFSALELSFFASPGTFLRSQMLQKICQQAHQTQTETMDNMIEVSYDTFMALFCYVFQINPEDYFLQNSQIASTLEEWEKSMVAAGLCNNEDDHMAASWVSSWSETILLDNAQTLLDSWVFFSFSGWTNLQVGSLFAALGRLYLDKKLMHFRLRLASAWQMTLGQLSAAENTSYFRSWIEDGRFLQCGEGNVPRLIALFTMFIHEVDWQTRLAAAEAILRSVGADQDREENSNHIDLSLGYLLSQLPLIVKKMRDEGRTTDLYHIYCRLIDELTVDREMLSDEADGSLEQAEMEYKKARELLSKRAIGDKMVDIWAKSLHRLREELQNRRNASLAMEQIAREKEDEENGRKGRTYDSSSSSSED